MHEREGLKIRFDDGGKVKARSICGTRGVFQTYLDRKQKEQAKAAHAKKLLKAAARKRGNMGGASSRGTLSRLESNRSHSMLRHEKSDMSTTNVTFAANEEAEGLQEKVSERDESNESPRAEDKTILGYGGQVGLTPKQKRAHEKFSLYEKAWDRMNRQVNGKTHYHRQSLIDKQRHYLSPREDCLSDFYVSAQKSVSMCPNEKKRSIMIE